MYIQVILFTISTFWSMYKAEKKDIFSFSAFGTKNTMLTKYNYGEKF